MTAKFIYFLKPVGMDGPIKIGCSAVPKTRLTQLMSWVPFELEILTTAPGGYTEEKRLHHRFGADRIRAEWFRTSRRLLALIGEIRKTGELPFPALGNEDFAVMLGLPAVLQKNGITVGEFAARAGVKTASAVAWGRSARARSSVGRVISTLESLGVNCPMSELFDGPDLVVRRGYQGQRKRRAVQTPNAAAE